MLLLLLIAELLLDTCRRTLQLRHILETEGKAQCSWKPVHHAIDSRSLSFGIRHNILKNKAQRAQPAGSLLLGCLQSIAQATASEA